MSTDIPTRVKQCIEQASMPQNAVAEQVGLSDSQLSKSLGGQRAFSSGELARLAALFNVSMYWLATGEQDPNGYRLVARHTFDRAGQRYEAAGLEQDDQLLRDLALVYRQAYA